MDESFKKWLCDLLYLNYYICIPENHTCPTKAGSIECIKGECNGLGTREITLEILIKTMWAIIREGKYMIAMNKDYFSIHTNDDYIEFLYDEHNNSETEALEAALKYIYDNRR